MKVIIEWVTDINRRIEKLSRIQYLWKISLISMERRSPYLYIVALLIIVVIFVRCEDEYDNDILSNLQEPQKLINPHSLNYDRINKKMIYKEDTIIKGVPLKHPGSLTIEVKQDSRTSNDGSQERIFYTRLVNLLLMNIAVQTKDNGMITGILTLKMTDSQMKALTNMQTEKTSLREIDAIMSEIIMKPGINLVAEAISIVNTFYDKFEPLYWTITHNINAIVIGILAMFIGIQLLKMNTSRGLPICILIQIIFVASFLITWWQLIREAEIKLTAQQRMYSSIPIACEPEKMNIWHKFVATISPTNDCEKYYEAVMTNANLKVSPALALSHMMSTVILHPVSNIGYAISEFIDKSTSQLSCYYAWIVKLILFCFVGVVLVMIPFCLSGASFNIGLGPLFKFGLDFKKQNTPQAIKEKKGRKPVKIIREIYHIQSAPAITAGSESQETKVQAIADSCKSYKKKSRNNQDSKTDLEEFEQDGNTSEYESDTSTSSDVTFSKVRRKKAGKTEIGAGDA